MEKTLRHTEGHIVQGCKRSEIRVLIVINIVASKFIRAPDRSERHRVVSASKNKAKHSFWTQQGMKWVLLFLSTFTYFTKYVVVDSVAPTAALLSFVSDRFLSSFPLMFSQTFCTSSHRFPQVFPCTDNRSVTLIFLLSSKLTDLGRGPDLRLRSLSDSAS